jgi:hypothetical protein
MSHDAPSLLVLCVLVPSNSQHTAIVFIQPIDAKKPTGRSARKKLEEFRSKQMSKYGLPGIDALPHQSIRVHPFVKVGKESEIKESKDAVPLLDAYRDFLVR